MHLRQSYPELEEVFSYYCISLIIIPVATMKRSCNKPNQTMYLFLFANVLCLFDWNRFTDPYFSITNFGAFGYFLV